MHTLTQVYRKKFSFLALILSLAIASFGFAIQIAKADVDPAGCTDNGGGVSIAAFRSDGVTNIGVGTVSDGELIKYQATLFAAPFPPNCAYEGGTWTLTTPDGVSHPLGSVPRIGGTGVSSFSSSLISYTVNHSNEIVNSTRHINATTAYGGGISHADPIDETDGPTLGASKITKVIHTPSIVTDIHNAAHGVVTSVPVGTTVHDSATVTGEPISPALTGTVTFTLYTDASCSVGATDAGTVALVAGVADPSNTFTPATSGSASYKAHYNGDSNYTPADAQCEPLTITKLDSNTSTDVHNVAHTVITSAMVGDIVHDNATVTGSLGTPTGNVSFQLYSDGSCTATNGDPLVVALDGTGHAETTGIPATAPSMSYKASYQGDGVYNESVGNCEPLTVNLYTPTVVTDIHNAAHTVITSATAGDTVHDSATVTGSGPTPTGNVTFDFFTNGTCNSVANATSGSLALSGGSVDATGFAQGPLAAGSYSFKAHYAGDGNYVTGNGQCEPLTVSQLTPTVVTEVHDAAENVITTPVLAPITAHDKATVSGSGPVPTGTVDFTFFNNGTCNSTGTASGTGIALVAGVAHPSSSQGPLSAGSYSFKAHYNGDITYSVQDGLCEPFTVYSQGHIIVDKVTLPSGDPQSFNFTTTGTGYNGFSLTDAATPNDQTLDAGTYSVAETSISGWTQTSAVCTDGQNSVNPASINLVAGHTVNCVFTNTKKGHLIVDKVTVPSTGDSLFFSIIASGNGTITGGGAGSVSDATNKDYEVTPGTYGVTELSQTGWTQTGNTCSGIVIGPGETKTCVITNTKNPNTTTLNTTPNPSSGTVGVVLNDTATLSGAISPTGSITFNLYPPSDATCAGPASYNQVVALSGNSSSTNPGFTSNVAGTWRWTANYPGDANNAPSSSGCQSEKVTITQAVVQWCSHGYWKNHSNWPAPYTPNELFSSVFDNAFPGKTLHDVLAQGGGGLNALGRDTVGELLNGAKLGNPGQTPAQVISMFDAVYPGSASAYDTLHNQFVFPENCPL